MTCSNCEKTIEVDSRFCQFCGHKANKKDTEIAEQGSVDAYFENKHETLTEETKKVAIQEIITGVVFAAGGGIITWITYEAASDGGTYFVFWGLIIYGIYKIFKGLVRL